MLVTVQSVGDRFISLMQREDYFTLLMRSESKNPDFLFNMAEAAGNTFLESTFDVSAKALEVSAASIAANKVATVASGAVTKANKCVALFAFAWTAKSTRDKTYDTYRALGATEAQASSRADAAAAKEGLTAAAGAAGGAAGGAFFGSLGGPYGTVLGLLGGCVMGALFGTAAEVVLDTDFDGDGATGGTKIDEEWESIQHRLSRSQS